MKNWKEEIDWKIIMPNYGKLRDDIISKLKDIFPEEMRGRSFSPGAHYGIDKNKTVETLGMREHSRSNIKRIISLEEFLLDKTVFNESYPIF